MGSRSRERPVCQDPLCPVAPEPHDGTPWCPGNEKNPRGELKPEDLRPRELTPQEKRKRTIRERYIESILEYQRALYRMKKRCRQLSDEEQLECQSEASMRYHDELVKEMSGDGTNGT